VNEEEARLEEGEVEIEDSLVFTLCRGELWDLITGYIASLLGEKPEPEEIYIVVRGVGRDIRR
jgi:hypothetical protein